MKRPEGERGSVTIWLALASMVMILLVGLAVDFTGQVQAQQRARDLAAQAARIGGQQITAADAMAGQVRANPAAAVHAAKTYLKAADVTGDVAVRDAGTRLIVNTTAYYDTKFLGIIGLSRLRVTGHAEARLVEVQEGVER